MIGSIKNRYILVEGRLQPLYTLVIMKHQRFFCNRPSSFKDLVSNSESTYWTVFIPKTGITCSKKFLETLIRNRAEETHKQYPQYKNHWDDFVLGVSKKIIRRKSGVIQKGEYVLVDTKKSRDPFTESDAVIFTTTSDGDWVVDKKDITVIAADQVSVTIYENEK